MWKDKVQGVVNYIIKHSKVAFPVIVIAAVAVTVTIALNAGNADKAEESTPESATAETAAEVAIQPIDVAVPLVKNEDSAVHSIIATYYNAVALGDEETLRSICDEISEKDMLRYLETAKYIEMYPVLDIYTKPGMEEGSTIAYVYYKVTFANQEEEFPGYQAHYICTNEQGEMYIKRGENTEEVNQYIRNVSAQDDVVEFNNRITVEYNELMVAHPELLEYLSELDSQVSTSVGEVLAQQAAAQAAENAATENTENAGEGESTPAEQTQEGQNAEQPQEEVQNTTQYAEATTTVNVRSSDSEQADKLGKVAGGTKVEVLEQRVNGWSKIVFEGKEGYIKSEFLQLAESAESVEVVGTVTATTNINVRSSASETADRLGVLAGGDSTELVAREGDWCKIKYNGQIGYVKAEYVQ